jgi:hypothetical protein
MYNVQISSPSYDGRISQGAMAGIMQATLNPELKTLLRICDCSSLTRVFNTLWCQALNDRPNITHFAMIHDDIAPQPGWLDCMMGIMEKKKCDVLSAIVPQKTTQGLTSTAWDLGTGHYAIKRMTIREAYKMDVTVDDPNLLINTGLMLVDMRKPWVENICFRFEDDIIKVDGKYQPVEISEDWYFSREARKLGAVLMATRAVDVKHMGRAAYVNTQPWGSLETDDVKL